MSKVATYLQGHVAGMLTARNDVRERYSYDGSLLHDKPDMVIYPQTTNDIRKVLRFAWQLAQKGHALPVTARGYGVSTTGGALGSGIVLDLSRSMNHVYEYEPKQKLVRLQPGADARTVESALRLHGAAIPSLVGLTGTIGGAIADDGRGVLGGKYGGLTSAVRQMEVVLDSGDVIQTGRISKREFNRRRGLEGREGDIYRGIGAVLDDHAEVIGEIADKGTDDASGYPGILEVEGKGGTIDLTPLFIGSQGTLGIISEMIMHADYLPAQYGLGIAVFDSSNAAHDAIDILYRQSPAILDYYDGRFVSEAIRQGSNYSWLLGKDGKPGEAVVFFGFDEHGERARAKKLKKAAKTLSQLECDFTTSLETDPEVLMAFRDVIDYSAQPTDHVDRGSPAIVESFFVSAGHFDKFRAGLADLEKSLHVDLPIYGSALSQLYCLRPMLSLSKVADKQKALKIIDRVNALILENEGSLVGSGGEGRLLSRFARAGWSDEYLRLVDDIKKVFDPHGILNPQSKAEPDLKSLVASLRSDNHLK